MQFAHNFEKKLRVVAGGMELVKNKCFSCSLRDSEHYMKIMPA